MPGNTILAHNGTSGHGNVGVGTTTPAAKLDIVTTPTATSGSIFGAETILTPAPGAMSSANYRGNSTQISYAGDQTMTGQTYVNESLLNYSSGATLVNGWGDNTSITNSSSGTITNSKGSSISISNNSTGTITNAVGVDVALSNSGAGTFGNAIALNGVVSKTTGTLTNATGVYAAVNDIAGSAISIAKGLDISVTGGSIANSYGIYMTAIQGVNKWSIYASDSAAPSYFAGNVGIGTASPGAKLDVTDASTTTSAIIVPRAGTFTGTTVNGMIRYNTTSTLFEFYQNGGWVNYTAVSDGRLKTNVIPITDGLSIVRQLNPVFYDWDRRNPKTSSFEDKHQVGFIAQEVEEVLPEVVNQGEDSYRSLEYGKIVSVAIAAIKELYYKILDIKSDVENLKAKDAAKDREIASVKAENADLKAKAQKAEEENAALKVRLDKIEKTLNLK